MQRKALYDRGAYSGCDTFLLTYLPYHEMAPYKSSSAFGYGSYEECFDTRELGLGTADVRTQEGAYWIVTRPNGYRVDYKAWGPSNEEDLGTFSSRRQAQAKIVEHAGGPGAIRHAKRR